MMNMRTRAAPKYFCLAATLAAMALLAPGCQDTCSEDEHEGMQITLSTLSPPEEWEFARTICPEGDKDEITVELQPGQMVMVMLEEGNLDEFALHDSTGAEVTSGSPLSFTNTGTDVWTGEVHAESSGTGEYHLHFQIMMP